MDFISFFSIMIKVMLMIFNCCFYFFLLFLFLILIIKLVLIRKEDSNSKSITFLHPNCADCGGGEKVLWEMIKGLLDQNDLQIEKLYILCCEDDDGNKNLNKILDKVKDRFNLEFEKFNKVKSLQLIRSSLTNLLAPKSRFTMMLQIFGQIYFSLYTSIIIPKNTYICDTTGLPFTYLFYKILGFKLFAYTHYPFISEDMIAQVRNGDAGYVHTKNSNSSMSFVLKYLKIIYYTIILEFYKINGNCLDFSFTNSSWTDSHIQKIYSKIKTIKLYPPCQVPNLTEEEKNRKRENIIVSLAQFRPEKDHPLQIKIANEIINKKLLNYKFYIMGACRNEEDGKIVKELKDLVNHYNLQNNVEILVNLKFEEIQNNFKLSKIGIHTMKDEHFGISVIEMMASGLITIAHDSAGPKNDIIGNSQQVGFLATCKLYL